jgi:hypothetical protein
MISGLVPVRQMHVHDTWAVRDLPVLDATIGLLEHSHMVTVTDIAAQAGFDPSVVAQALDALDPVYVDFRKTTTGGDPRYWYVYKVTPEARRAVGQWPSAEALASRLAGELSAAADRENDAQQQSLLAYAARLIGDTLRDATVRAAEAVLAPAFGGIPVPEYGQQVPPPVPHPDIEFESLVPLPELPELLRPQLPEGQDQAAQAEPVRLAAQAEPAPEVERAPQPAWAEPAPLPPVQAEEVPPPAAQAESAPLPIVRAEEVPLPTAWAEPAPLPPVQAEEVPPPTAWAEPAPQVERVAQPAWAEPAPLPSVQAEEVPPPAAQALPVESEQAPPPELNPWPEVEPAPFRPSIAPWPAVDADTADTDAGAADTHPDLMQVRQDAV